MSTIPQFKARRKWKRMMYSPLSVAILAVVFIFLAKAAWDMYGTYRLSESKLTDANRQMDALQSQEEGLSASIAQLSTPAGVDDALRTNFRVVKPGESLAVIVDSQASTAPSTTTPPGFWARLGAWFSRAF